MNYRIALIHGFFRNYKDMEELENNLMNMGYTVDNLNFPLTFPSIDMSIEILKKYLLSLKEKKINKQNEIVLIGFGFGGVLIREIIIGRESSGFFGKWLGDYNDGYIEMKDVAFPAAKDKILIPITHNELNKRIGTARYIHNFIAKGKFRLE